MADFSKIDWFEVIKLVSEVQAEIKALQDAVGVEDQAKAVGELAQTFVGAAEAFSGKDLVNDAAFKALIEDVVKAIGDANHLKPVV